ncbi:leucine-rich repeat and fibronectin type-III domain-containing protein 5-like [Dreissena polymorpha]|uniref:Ig-like domain-containing protein n=1 Tax=Dreissena polymorpha TaxID=45954 RepID=A0A9D4EYG1_DREPO|nr:leucine-rich repeat and fibronectin type-III domain-containing protein 5-like [Dreissena polymorpha]KAH3789085.1 hypothetical protein DPMN_167254 [Dreissena polymorpha]
MFGTLQESVYALLLLLYVVTCPRVTATTCPAVCFCPSVSRVVYCPRKALPFIPAGIPTDTVQLTLNDNKFQNPVISRANFSNYRDLEQLYLTDCGIEYIEPDTFVDNKKLKWLDLGKNKLKRISDFTFRDLTLDHLFLNDNPGVEISTRAFGGLKTTGLYMQNNAMDKLSLEVIRPMNGTLKTLWIDGNKFDKFNPQWLFLFRTLSHLRIGDNPLHCNCEARWLHEFYTASSRIFENVLPPACRSPGQLRGQTFKDLHTDDFKCQLPVFKNVDVILEKNVGKLTCLASGDPVPTIYWMKPDGTAEVFIPKSEDITKDMEGVMYIRDPRAELKNRYQCVANNPAGNVTFSINVAWPADEVDVTKQYEQHDNPAIEKTDDKKVDEKDEKKIQDTKEGTAIEVFQSNSSKVVGTEIATVSAVVKDRFTTSDLIGAVVGTFVLTLLLCVIVFYVIVKYQRKPGTPVHHHHHHNGVHNGDIKRGPPSRHELDEVEHTMKMLDKRSYDIHV